jgi:hypothetical protein
MTNSDVSKTEFLNNISKLLSKNKGKNDERFLSVYNLYTYIDKNLYVLKYFCTKNERQFLETMITKSDEITEEVFIFHRDHPLKDEMLFLLAKVADECQNLLLISN